MAAAMMEEPDNKGPRVPWDESGLIQNVMSNLTLLDGHGDPPRGFSIVLATEEERKAVVELRKWANDFKRTHEGSIFLTREIEDLFYNLPSHRKGKPSFLYSLVQRTVQELSDVSRIQAKKFQEDASKSEESLNTLASQQVKLPLIVKNLKLEKNELQESFNNLEKELLESQSHSALLFGEEERLRSKSEALTKKIGELRSKNEELTHKLKTRKESDENPEKRKEISLKYRKEREVLVNKAIDSKSSQLENSVSYKDSAESSLVKSKTLHSRLTSLLIKIKELRASLRQPEDSERVDNTSEISVTRASGEVKKEGQISKKDSSKKTEVISPEPDKQFSWDHASNLRDNLEGLLKEYLKGSGHSLGRVLSAKRVLKKARK